MKILIIFVAFAIGYKFGYWDAKYGHEVGERHGKIVREYLIKNGVIK